MPTPAAGPPADRSVSECWPDRLIALCREQRAAADEVRQRGIRADMCLLVDMAMTAYIHRYLRSHGHLEREEIRDIASDKTLAVLRSLDTGTFDPVALTPAQVRGYLSAVARNGLVDSLRRNGKRGRTEFTSNVLAELREAPATDGAEINVALAQFVEALSDCVARLTPRARRVWFMRVFLELPSRVVGARAEIAMSPAAVDMLQSRTRRMLRACLEGKGFDAGDVPPGTFVAVWERLRS